MSDRPRFVQELRWMGYQPAYIEELLTWEDDEILEEIERNRQRVHGRGLSLRDRRVLADALAELRKAERGSGPSLIVTRGEVEAVRDQLIANGKPAGYDSIAKEGGWSRETVRRRLRGE
jgi:hypothetical protein